MAKSTLSSAIKSVGIVKAVAGNATATDKNGVIHILKIGDVVSKNDLVHTDAGSSLHIEFQNGSIATLSNNERLSLDDSLFSQPDLNTTPTSETDIAFIQEQIAAGLDPALVSEASAADQTTADNEGGAHQFVVIPQNAARGELTPGFESENLDNPISHRTLENYDYYEMEEQAKGELPEKEVPAGGVISVGIPWGSLPEKDQDQEPHDFDERIIMYLDQNQATGNDTYEITALIQAQQHHATLIEKSSDKGYGTATIDSNGNLLYTLNNDGKAALANAASHYVTDYVTYRGTDGEIHSVQIVLTDNTCFNARNNPFGHAVNGETHLSFIENAVYNINTTQGADILEFRQFNNSNLYTNDGNDTLAFHGSVKHSAITTGNGSNHITLADLVSDSVIALGNTNSAADTAGTGELNQLIIHGDISNSAIYGTAGTDEITLNGTVAGTYFEGGDGMDILHLADYTASDGSHHFSLDNFTNTDQNILHSFEILDFTGGENNILSIDTLLSNIGNLNMLESSKLGDISSYRGEDLTNSTVLRVTGDSGDTVNLGNNDHASWSNQGSVTYDGTNYNVYYDAANSQYALIDNAIQTVSII